MVNIPKFRTVKIGLVRHPANPIHFNGRGFIDRQFFTASTSPASLTRASQLLSNIYNICN